jgi:hypothetical protein
VPPRAVTGRSASSCVVITAESKLFALPYQFCTKTGSRCGDIFCYSHASNYLPLDESCQFDTTGQRSRVCNDCFEKHCTSFLPEDVQAQQTDAQCRQEISGQSQCNGVPPMLPSTSENGAQMSYSVCKFPMYFCFNLCVLIMSIASQSMSSAYAAGDSSSAAQSIAGHHSRRGCPWFSLIILWCITAFLVTDDPLPSVPSNWNWSTF